ICTGICLSQGAYLEREQNGVGIGAVGTSNRNAYGAGGFVGYSFSGIFDCNLIAAYASLKDPIRVSQPPSSDPRTRRPAPLIANLSSVTVSPGISYYIIKQDSLVTPVSIAVQAGFERDYFSAHGLEFSNLSMQGNYFSIGASAYRQFAITPAVTLQPFGEFT